MVQKWFNNQPLLITPFKRRVLPYYLSTAKAQTSVNNTLFGTFFLPVGEPIVPTSDNAEPAHISCLVPVYQDPYHQLMGF